MAIYEVTLVHPNSSETPRSTKLVQALTVTEAGWLALKDQDSLSYIEDVSPVKNAKL